MYYLSLGSDCNPGGWGGDFFFSWCSFSTAADIRYGSSFGRSAERRDVDQPHEASTPISPVPARRRRTQWSRCRCCGSRDAHPPSRGRCARSAVPQPTFSTSRCVTSSHVSKQPFVSVLRGRYCVHLSCFTTFIRNFLPIRGHLEDSLYQAGPSQATVTMSSLKQGNLIQRLIASGR